MDSNYPIAYRESQETKDRIPSGFKETEQMHHIVPAELFGAFVQNLSRQEAEIVINRANALGIRVGNDPANFVGLDKKTEHLRNDEYDNTVHQQLDDLGLESSELAGEHKKQFYGLLNKIASSDLKTRLEALPDFVTYIAEPAMDISRQFRPKANDIATNKKLYQRELKQERDNALREYKMEQAADALGTNYLSTVAKENESQVMTAIKNIKSGVDSLNIFM